MKQGREGNGGRESRLLHALVRLYPRSFREQFGDDVLRTLLAAHRAASASGVRGRVAFWLRNVPDLIVGAVRERIGGSGGRQEKESGMRSSKAGVVSWLEDSWADLRYAARALRKTPNFSVVAAFTVALGIGGTTVISSLVDAVLLRPLPVHEPDRLISVEEIRDSGEFQSSFSYPYVVKYREGAEEAVRMGAYGAGGFAFHAGDQAQVLDGSYVTGNYFDLLGIAPAHGRFFTTEEEIPGVPEPAAVISYGLWLRHFGGDPGVIGRTIRLNSQPLTVIGVAPSGFHGLRRGRSAEVWVPIPMYAALNPGFPGDIYAPGQFEWLRMFGRLNPGVSAPAADAVLGAIGRGITDGSESERGGTTGVMVSKLSGLNMEDLIPVRRFLGLLLATAGLVLLIACVNVAGMLLARATNRGREVGIRLALGAGRRHVIRQLLTESTLLFLVGGVGGVLLAFGLADTVTALLAVLAPELSLNVDARPDALVIGFGLLLALGTGLLFGLAPAFRASRPDVVSVLKEGGGAVGGRSRLRSAFVVGQISISLLLLVNAGLLVRSLQGALAVDPGMNADGVVVASVNVGPHGYDETRGRIFFEQLTDRLRAQRGVESVALARWVPLTGYRSRYGVEIPGHEPPAGADDVDIDFNVVGPDYFRTLQIPLLQGRGFTEADGPDAPAVVVVNGTMARRFWPDGAAIGERMRVGGEDVVIVGVAGGGKYHSLTEAPTPYLYLPFAQEYSGQMTLHVRAAGGLRAGSTMIRRELQRLDANVPLIEPASLAERIRISLLPQRVGAALIGSFGALGLLLAAVGLYGVLAYAVSQRAREIGVRLALGARAGDVLGMVLRQGSALLLAGLGIGLLLAFLATRLLGALLLNVSPTDPVTFIAVLLLLGAVALLASYLPARRATRVDPVAVLRTE